jgi:hypothetical protein
MEQLAKLGSLYLQQCTIKQPKGISGFTIPTCENSLVGVIANGFYLTE